MRRLVSFATLTASLSLAACSGTSTAPPAPPAATGPQTFSVATGASDPSAALEILKYYPASIVIDEGDTLTWKIASGSPHIIALVPANAAPPALPASLNSAGGTSFDGSAFVSSGLIAKGAAYSLTFPKAGTYRVLCLVHQPEMVQNITVQPKGTALSVSPANYAAAAGAQSATDVAAANSTLAGFPFAAGGTHLAVGLSPQTTPPSSVSIYRFLDGPTLASGVTVPAGTTLTWSNVSNVPHNIAFPVAGQTIPATFNEFAPAVGGPTYDGTALTTSGLVTPGKSFSLTFNKPGVYHYLCTLHDEQGMQSDVTVI